MANVSPTSTNVPTPMSYEQILADMLSAYASKMGLNDFNVGSAVTSFFEVVALTTARASGDIFQILRDYSIDRATGDALQRLAIENNVTPITASPSTTYVSIIDTTFQKISSNIYAGTTAPNIGSTTIPVGDASKFPASGSLYIGRGTPNIEGPISYSTPPVQVGTYWIITLNSPTTKFHNLGESVILAQGGNRSIPVNTIVIAPALGANPSIQYMTSQVAIILDGETTVTNVPITAILPGTSGQVPIGAISQFASPPFTGATVYNPLAVTTGTDNETDDELRVRIKNALASIGLGTAFAIQSYVLGAQSSTPVSATVTSTDLIEASYGALLYIDNGQGYEETSTGVGLESIIDSALGGEQFFQLACGGNQSSVAKAFLQSTLASPFDIKGGDTLAVIVGNTTYSHTFQDSDFRSPGAATAYEITASINGNTSLGFEALTAGSGTYVVIRCNTETNTNIEITTPITQGRDAAIQMGFPSGLIETLRLYKNKSPLSEYGNSAIVFTQEQSIWSSTIANGETLILSVDGTASITYTINDADFIATGLYNTVSNTNSLESWVEVFNNKLTGVTAEVVGTQIQISSNLNASNRAQVVIDPSSSLVAKGMFSSSLGLSAQGKASDYTLSRNTAQFELAAPLVAGDQLQVGNDQTSATIKSSAITAGNVTLSSEGYIWISIDNSASIIQTGVTQGTLLGVSTPSTNIVRYTSNSANAFSNVFVGDYVIIWSTDLPASDRLEGRVHAVSATTLDIEVTASEYAAITVVANVNFTQGFVVCRTSKSPQKFNLPVGTSTLDQVATYLQNQTEELTFSTSQEQYLLITTNTEDISGSLMLVTADAIGQQLNLPIGVLESSNTSLIASYDSGQYDTQMPLFLHAELGGDSSASPPDSFISLLTSSISLSSQNPNDLISFLQPYGSILDSQPYGDFVQETSVTGTSIGITQKPTIRRLRNAVDRFYLASPLNFGPSDSMVAIVDNNPTTNSFEIPFYRVATTNTTAISNANTFNATDLAAGGTQFASSFGSNFDFSNFKVLMQAKNVLQTSVANTAVLFRSAIWGKSGEYVQIAYTYPSSPNLAIGSTISNDELITININLASGASIPTSINSTTQWNITITSNTPSAGIDQVTFTWNGVGSAPNLTLSGGEYVNIGANSGINIANTGVFRVSTQAGFTPTTTAFSVQMPTGQAVAQSNAPTNVNGAIIFYSPSSTTANDIVSYVNASLSNYLSASIANYNVSNTGAGVIALSTYEDSGFTIQNIELKDGINWLASSALSSSPQFTFKNSLVLPATYGYAFNNSENVIFSPTTMEQVFRFISVLAVTGFSTLGSINLVDRGTRLQLGTKTLGSLGAIQIVGGNANNYQVPVLGSAIRIDNNICSVSVSNVAGAAIQSEQWFKLIASNTQAKETLVSTNTSVNILKDNPTTGQSTIQLLNRQLNQRYFGKTRWNVNVQGRSFKIEKQGSLVCLSADPLISSSPNFSIAVPFNDAAGGTVDVATISGTSNLQFTIVSGVANFNGLSIGDLVTIAGGSFNSNNIGTFLVVGISDDGTIMQVLNENGVSETGISFVAGNFSATTSISEGDTVIIGSPFNILNQGQFRVIRRYNDSIWFENDNVVEEEVSLPFNNGGITFDSTTSFIINATNHTQYLSWNGVGTEPHLEYAQMGDVVTFGTTVGDTTPFVSQNQGSFMVLRSGPKLQQIATLLMPSGSSFPTSGTGAYFDIWSAGNVTDYRIWFNVIGGTNNAPSGGAGITLIQVDINASDTSSVVANNLSSAILTYASADLTSSSSSGIVTVTTTGYQSTFAPANSTMPSPFTATVIQTGQRTFLECVNPLAVNQAIAIVEPSSLTDNRPQMLFYEYSASVPGDKINLTNTAFNANNIGSWNIVKTLNRDTAVVTGSLASISNVSLNGIVSSLFVEEGTPYSGYKSVKYVMPQQGTSTRNLVVFDTNAQSDQINQSASVQLTSLNKMNFDTTVKNGLDAYSYNTGLIQEANRIIYGDPRDRTTYPGVGAAGAEIFIRGPLIRRVQVALDVRLNTGVPFAQTVQQVQSTVSSLVNSNKLGQPLAISSILSAVSAIPGILAVSISFPNFSVTNDLIPLAPGEKALIINPTTDISVSQISG